MKWENRTIAPVRMGAQTKSMWRHTHIYIYIRIYIYIYTYNIHWDIHAHTHIHKDTDIDHIMYQSRLRSSTFPNLGIARGAGSYWIHKFTRFADSFCNSRFWPERPSHAQWCAIDTKHLYFAGTTSNSLFACLFAEPIVFFLGFITNHNARKPQCWYITCGFAHVDWQWLTLMWSHSASCQGSCQPGTYSTPEKVCQPCPMGQFSAYFGQTECGECLLGTFNDQDEYPTSECQAWQECEAFHCLPSGVIVLGSIKQTSRAEQALFPLWGMSYWELPQFSRRHSTGWL